VLPDKILVLGCACKKSGAPPAPLGLPVHVAAGLAGHRAWRTEVDASREAEMRVSK
jgi:hypothetical protein